MCWGESAGAVLVCIYTHIYVSLAESGSRDHCFSGRFINYFLLFGGGIREAFGGVWRSLGGSLLIISTPPFLEEDYEKHYILFLYHVSH